MLLVKILAPLLLLFTFASWSLGSAVGSSPDDNFHLASIWCGLGDREGLCENPSAGTADAAEETARDIPTSVTTSMCYVFRADLSAECWDQHSTSMTEVDRANIDGLYPKVFYAVMSVFASKDVEAATVAMRLFNSLFAVAFLTTAFFLLPRRLRPAFVVGAVVTSVPLGLFLYGSTNPSSWALLSASTVWITVYGTFRTEGWRRYALAAFAVFATLIGAGARADAAAYAVFGAIIGVILGARSLKRLLLPAVMVAVIAVMSVAFYLSTGQSNAVSDGLGIAGIGNEKPPLNLAQHLSNFVGVPDLWRGALGGWGLGWLDTPLPPVVPFIGVAVFGAVLVVGFGRRFTRQTIALLLAIAAFWLVPFVLLARSNAVVGELVQPRYILPLLVIAAGVAGLRLGKISSWSGMRGIMASLALAASAAVALYYNIRRYTTGLDTLSLDPGKRAEWWWSFAPSPLAVWVIGSVSFAACLILLVRSAAAPAVDTVATSPSASGADSEPSTVSASEATADEQPVDAADLSVVSADTAAGTEALPGRE